MFGIVRPCWCASSGEQHSAWVGHVCGVCLALRDCYGHPARLTTTTDAAVVSALVDAQRPVSSRRRAGPCALRGMRTAEVSTGSGAQLAAAVSLILASAKLRDHAQDGDGWARNAWFARRATGLAGRWERRVDEMSASVGLDGLRLRQVIAQQHDLERSMLPGDPVTTTAAPTASVTATAFAHTAVLAGRPEHTAPLHRVGEAFGTLAYLLDAVEDHDDDVAAGAFNPLALTRTSSADARQVCEELVAQIGDACGQVRFDNELIIHKLLVNEPARAVRRTFAKHPHRHRGLTLPLCFAGAAAMASDPYAKEPRGSKKSPSRHSSSSCCDCCTCAVCCEACDC